MNSDIFAPWNNISACVDDTITINLQPDPLLDMCFVNISQVVER